jgi:hypothetical protein
MNEIINKTDKVKVREKLIEKYYEYYYAIDVKTPNHAQIEELKRFIEEYPAFVWGETANLTNKVIKDYFAVTARKNFIKVVLEESMKMIKDELKYETSSIIEKMIIDSIVISWVQLQHMEGSFTKSLYEKDCTFNERKQWDSLLSSAHKRYLRAIDSLVRLRKTGVNLQINIATNVGTQKVQQKVK